MKLRPVLLVLVLLTGFYYVTTHGAPTQSLGWVHSVPAAREKLVSVAGPSHRQQGVEVEVDHHHRGSPQRQQHLVARVFSGVAVVEQLAAPGPQ